MERAMKLLPDEEATQMILNKSDLAAETAAESGLSNGDAKLAIEKTFELIARHIAAGDEVNLTGFGKFSAIDRGPRQGRNPQAGEPLEIAASRAPKFAAAAALKRSVKA